MSNSVLNIDSSSAASHNQKIGLYYGAKQSSNVKSETMMSLEFINQTNPNQMQKMAGRINAKGSDMIREE
jgi:hypothetical protein